MPNALQHGAVVCFECQDFTATIRDSPFLHLSSIQGLTGRTASIPIDAFLAHERRRPAPDRPSANIFHVGNVGSTLCATLLQEIVGGNVMREPGILRQIAVARYIAATAQDRGTLTVLDDLAIALIQRWRSFQPRLAIKHTSLSAILAPTIIGSQPRSRNIVISTTMQNFVGHALASPAAAKNVAENRKELQAFLEALLQGRLEAVDFTAVEYAAALKWVVIMHLLVTQAGLEIVDFDAVGGARDTLLRQLAAVMAGDPRDDLSPEVALDHAAWGINPKTSKPYSFEQRAAAIRAAYAAHASRVDAAVEWGRRTVRQLAGEMSAVERFGFPAA